MPPVLGYVIVIAALGAVCVLAGRSIWKSRKKGGCNGDCCNCKGCH